MRPFKNISMSALSHKLKITAVLKAKQIYLIGIIQLTPTLCGTVIIDGNKIISNNGTTVIQFDINCAAIIFYTNIVA